ncbi:quaternary ammonium compound efflux SMR transporter SugE [Pseudomonas sp.]|uniref:quaternary ammonium compound efflux SMR transporter SugE n=1 Tax=Pseudomonas sp. TaxID=306 RepID=UPI0028AE9FBD|nr:quaternary ammonium compound efflux SMR transporter SugE [Pseudomonas sp.]
MSWIILFCAGLFEIGWAVGLKYTDGFTRPLPTALTIGAMIVSIGLLGMAVKELPLGTAYAVWTGVGAVGTVIAGILLFGESMAPIRIASVVLIVAGLIGLKVSAS